MKQPMAQGPVIQVNGVGKCYQIYHQPKDRLKQAIWRGRRQYFQEFWALRNVSFSMNRGETLGIIGRNGSGKSTLLQLICGTLTPTTGSLNVNGKVAALLELGSGFNPEFTGVENVYLNASLYGLNKRQVDERIEDILAFADIGEFIDQPVKTYSSGMTVRLAFAVIAHVDAEIMIVDEALSVGDIFFTQRCMRFMKKFASENSLLLVSHDTATITTFCDRLILLRKGELVKSGPPKDVIIEYLKHMHAEAAGKDNLDLVDTPKLVDATESGRDVLTKQQASENPEAQHQARDFRQDKLDNSNLSSTCHFLEIDPSTEDQFGCGGATLLSAEFLVNGVSVNLLTPGVEVVLRIRARCQRFVAAPIIGFAVRNARGQDLFADNTCISHPPGSIHVEMGDICQGCFFFLWPHLPDGEYTMVAAIGEGIQSDWKPLHTLPKARSFQSVGTRSFGVVGMPMKNIVMEAIKAGQPASAIGAHP